jgi:hypothetical protein
MASGPRSSSFVRASPIRTTAVVTEDDPHYSGVFCLHAPATSRRLEGGKPWSENGRRCGGCCGCWNVDPNDAVSGPGTDAVTDAGMKVVTAARPVAVATRGLAAVQGQVQCRHPYVRAMAGNQTKVKQGTAVKCSGGLVVERRAAERTGQVQD